jgi:hypothetical protein
MRVVEVQFGTYTAYTAEDGSANTKKRFTAAQHDMQWLPEERLLLIDGWRYELGPGGRFRTEEPPGMLPTDDPSMFTPAAKIAAMRHMKPGYDQAIVGMDMGSSEASVMQYTDKDGTVYRSAPRVVLAFEGEEHELLPPPAKEPDGTDQPSKPAGPARGKKRRK